MLKGNLLDYVRRPYPVSSSHTQSAPARDSCSGQCRHMGEKEAMPIRREEYKSGGTSVATRRMSDEGSITSTVEREERKR